VDWLIARSADGTETHIGCDILVQYDHDFTIEHAKYPVETGFDVSDHSVINPETLSVKLLQSATPLESLTTGSPKKLEVRASEFKPGGLLWLTTQVANAIGSAISAITGSSEPELKIWTFDQKPSKDWVNEFHQALLNAAKDFAVCTVILKQNVYMNIRISKISRSYTADLDGAESFSVDFEEFRTAETATTSIPRIVKPKVSKGKAGSKEMTDEQKAVLKKSMLVKLGEGAWKKLFPDE